MSLDQLIRIAHELAETDPLASFQLRQAAESFTRTAVINPGAQKFSDKVKEIVKHLKTLDKELEKALDEVGTMDAKEFAAFFTDLVNSEEEQLKALLDETKKLKTAAKIAGPLDFIKNLFKKDMDPDHFDKKDKKKDKLDKDDEVFFDDSSSEYSLSDKDTDDFVEGKKDWEDPSAYVEKERLENEEFFDSVDGILKQVERVRKKPSKDLVHAIQQALRKIIESGENIIKGLRKSMPKKPAKPEAKMDEGGLGEKPKPSKKDKPSGGSLENTVGHYVDMLKEALGDEKKTVKLLKELFQTVKPAIQDDRAQLATVKALLPVLVRVAHQNPGLRDKLLPRIKRMTLQISTPRPR